jgi:hypothetical protein
VGRNDTFGTQFNYCPYCQNELPNKGCSFFKNGRQFYDVLTDTDFCMPSESMSSCIGFQMKPGINPPPPWYDPRGNIAREYAGLKDRQ